MADGMLGLLVILSFGSCFTDPVESRSTPWRVLPSPGKPTVSKVDGLAVTLTWLHPENGNATQKYEVRYQADGKQATIHKKVNTNWTTLNLDPNKWYTIHVKALSPNGKGSWSDALRIYSNESRPGKAPPNVVVRPMLPSLRVTWDPIPPEHHNGVLMGYVIFIKKYGTADWRNHHVNGTSIHLKGLDTMETYTIRVAGLTKGGTGTRSVAIHFDSNGLLVKTTPRPFKTGAPIAVASTQETTYTDVTMKVARITDKSTKVTVRVNSEGEVRGRVPTGWISTAETTVTKDIHNTSPNILQTESLVDYSQDDLDETTIVRNLILFGGPAFGFTVLLLCFVGCVLWHRKRSRQKKLGSDAPLTKAERRSMKGKPVVTRGENTVTYLPPKYSEKQTPVSKRETTPYNVELTQPLASGTLNVGDVYDDDNKQRIYESMDGLHSALNGEDEDRYAEPDQLCVVLPSIKHCEPSDVQVHQPTKTRDPRNVPQYANASQSDHLYEALRFKGQDAKAGLNSDKPYDTE